VELALDVRLALRDLLGRDVRRREQLGQIRAGQPLECARVRDLVDAAADEQVAGQRARRRVLDHLVHPQLAAAGARLEEVVVREVLDQVAGGEDVLAGPRLALRVERQRALPAEQVVLAHARALDVRQRRLRRLAVVDGRCAGEHRVDRGRDELDVAELLGGDVRDQVVERPRFLAAAEVERLERVVHERRHLAEAPAHQLLDGGGAVGIGIRGRGKLDAEPVDALDHEGLAFIRGKASPQRYPSPRGRPRALSKP
jgi:hypothetical protein